MEAIPHLALDTSALPADEQFGHWSAHSRNTILTAITPGPFLARGRLWHTGSLCLAESELDPFTSDRTNELVRSTGVDLVQLVALHDGSARFQDEEQDRTCRAPDLFVRDYARPSVVTTTRLRVATVYFARAFLETATGPFAFQGPLPWCAETAALSRTLRTVTASLPNSAATSADFYARTLRDLLAAAVHRVGQSRRPAGADHLAQWKRIRRFIAAAPPGSVSVNGLVLALGLSRTALFDLFGPHGGVLSYDRLRRLRALYRDLSNPAERGSVAELGARHGFLDKAVLARSYRRAFGCSPRDTRAGASGRQSPADTAGARIRGAINRAAE